MFDINPRAAFFTLTAIGAVTFALFWKGKLPEAIAKPVGRITLLPQLPFTIFTQLYVRNWWDELVPGRYAFPLHIGDRRILADASPRLLVPAL